LYTRICEEFARTPGATLSGVARRVGRHLHTVETEIEAESGKSPRDWKDERLAEAVEERLVAQPDRSVKEVAADFGRTTNGLRRLMRRHCGKTPTEIRGGGDVFQPSPCNS
jgi:AraC-like DNA-binding protein